MVWGKKGSRNVIQGKGTTSFEGIFSFGSIAIVAMGTSTQGHQNQQNQHKKWTWAKAELPYMQWKALV